MPEGRHIDNLAKSAYRRDTSLSGNEYNSLGFENLPDDY